MEETTGSFNKLTPAEVERIVLVIEECGEVIQAASKVLRHGYSSFNPADLDSLGNRLELEEELGQLLAVIGVMANSNDVDPDGLKSACAGKLDRLKEFTHHQL